MIKDLSRAARKVKLNFRSTIGMLTRLTRSANPDITTEVYQVAPFSSNTKLLREKAIVRIGRCLSDASNLEIFYKLDE